MPDCPGCGAEIAEDDRFCFNCGKELLTRPLRKPLTEVEEVKKVELIEKGVTGFLADFLMNGERVKLKLNPHKFPYFVRPIVFVIIALFLTALGVESELILLIAIPILLIAIIRLVYKIIYWYYTILLVTDKRVAKITGVIGKRIEETTHERVQSIELNIGIIGRIFGYGNIGFTTAGTSGYEIVFDNVPDPRMVQRRIRELVSSNQPSI